MRVLLTNDDGIHADGLQALRRALLELVPGIELAVIAPDGNRSAMARSITTRRPLWVERVEFDDGTYGFATDGTPVDCVRLAKLGLVEGFTAEAVVSGINHGSNLGDDILAFEIEADAFMRQMNRVLVGTMLEVAAGRRTPESFAKLLEGAHRRDAGVTAPPHGLYLVGVRY